MVRIATLPDLPMVQVDSASPTPLYQQVYDAVRRAILTGQLAAGTRLPASRTLATALRVSRNTVVNAFAQLIAEGYIVGQVGAGTVVAQNLPDDLLAARQRVVAPVAEPGTDRRIAERGKILVNARVVAIRETRPVLPFRSGVPALDLFPTEVWTQITTRVLKSTQRDLLSYGDPAGYLPLREAVAAYVGMARAVRCRPEQVIIVSGSQQGLDLAARVLVDPGDAVWVEEPGYLGARGALLAAQARLIPVPVDAEGIDVAAGTRICPDARLAYVSPSHQFPLGVTMSLARRLALLEWANRAGSWILEDDFDSEYRYTGRPLTALQGLDQHARVIYIGTFSKVLFPALRLGYLVVPPDLVDVLVAARAVTDRQSPSIEQAVLAEFITAGHFARHIRRMRLVYAARQAALVTAVRRELGDLLEIGATAAGMHLAGYLPHGTDDARLAAQCAQHGIITQALSGYSIGAAPRPGFVLGYAAYDETALQAGVRQLAAVVRRSLTHGPAFRDK